MSRLQEAVALFYEARASRVLYHIGKRPAAPKPAHAYAAGGVWERPGRKPVTNGVFLTPDPVRVGLHHGVPGHVYAYRVPEHVIQSAGRVRTYDRATELLIPDHLWHHVEFLGKSMDRKDFGKKIRAAATQARISPPPKKGARPPVDQDKLAQALQRMKGRPFVRTPSPQRSLADLRKERRGL